MDRQALGIALGVGGALLAGRALVHASRDYDLDGKIVLITGGSRGLGFAMAREFARRGARLALCARDEAELEEARKRLTEEGADVFCAPCDVTEKEEVEHFVRRVREEFGQIDVLVNNAGVFEVGPVETMNLADFEESMQTHFYGPLYMTLEVLPEMRRRRDGRIVNISSIGGLLAVPHLLPYSASKFALTGLSEGLRAELAYENVIVTTVCPGLMRTGSPVHAYFKGHALAEFRWFLTGAALPGASMNADKAARRVVKACRRGRAMLILTPHAKLGAKVNRLFPELTSDLMELADRMLPDSYRAPEEKVEGIDLAPPRGGSLVDRLNRFAATRLNEYAQ
ncbi:MAG: SDR family NAD(P)-dependent oxidoreductase [Myxococcaceae bacterium]